MELIEIKFCEVHTPLFLAGTNLQLKLDPSKRTGLILKFDEEKKRLIVTWNGETGWVPETNIVIMVPGTPKASPSQITHPMIADVSSAQVETPFGHVHAGPGHGKKR